MTGGALFAPARAVWGALEGIGSLVSIEREMRGMRSDMREVIASVEGLRDDVRAMGDGVGGIRASTESLEAKIDEVAVHLESVALLTGRLGRFGGRRPRAVGDE